MPHHRFSTKLSILFCLVSEMNAESSRSHLILGIVIESTNLTSGAVVKGKVSELQVSCPVLMSISTATLKPVLHKGVS